MLHRFYLFINRNHKIIVKNVFLVEKLLISRHKIYQILNEFTF